MYILPPPHLGEQVLVLEQAQGGGLGEREGGSRVQILKGGGGSCKARLNLRMFFFVFLYIKSV